MKEAFEKIKERLEENVCKWKEESERSHIVCGHGQVEYRYKVRDWSFCPYCGKKVKVVE